MAREIEIQLGPFSEGEHLKVHNFVEDVWRETEKRGWAEHENFDHRVNPGAKVQFKIPARASHEVATLVEKLAKQHFMQGTATVTHRKRTSIDG
jgi:hypothetical protein